MLALGAVRNVIFEPPRVAAPRSPSARDYDIQTIFVVVVVTERVTT